MRNQLMWIRGLTATVLFVMLAKVNVWADTQTHMVLAVGYRTFLLCAPLFMFVGLRGGMKAALAFSLLGAVVSLHSVNWIGMAAFGLGMAISGYFAKFVSSHTSQGASDNKVALNIGSLASGLLLMVSVDRIPLLALISVILAVTIYLSCRIDWKTLEAQASHAPSATGETPRLEALPLLGWSLIGVATGIKLTGIFTILPQYLLAQLGTLPSWYGSVVILNSVAVIVLQHSVLKFLDRGRTISTFALSLSAMLLLAAPSIFGVQSWISSAVWTLLLTIGECALSRYDRLAKMGGYLFPKELMVGVGSFATVALSRNFPESIYLSGLLGAVCLSVGSVLAMVKPRVISAKLTVGAIRSIRAQAP